MDNDLLKIFSEELRETRNLARAAERKADAAWQQVEINHMNMTAQTIELSEQTKELCNHFKEQTTEMKELVIITRNKVSEELAELRRPWWKKLSGTPAEA